MPNDRCALLWYPLGNPLRSRRTGLSRVGRDESGRVGGEAQGRFRETRDRFDVYLFSDIPLNQSPNL